MDNKNNLCMNCMEEKDKNSTVCPHCGFDESKMVVPPHHLRYGTKLNKKYLIGRALGEGGFGITYIGWDCDLYLKVAIKEYYPNGIVIRNTGENTQVFTCTGKEDGYHRGREKFLEEAQRLAKFNDIDGVVKVRDFFRENNTSYIVMEYLEGKTLKQYLEEQGGRLTVQDLSQKMKPIVEALEQIHRTGLIHRDISPDNIMLLKSGKLKLLDFGAAREFAGEDEKTLSIMLKPGYAPAEQYFSKGKQGAWTDIYALCATWYKCLSGETPPGALDRLSEDCLKPLHEMGVRIDKRKEQAIEKGLSVKAENRFQTIGELKQELYSSDTNESHTVVIDENNINGNSSHTVMVDPVPFKPVIEPDQPMIKPDPPKSILKKMKKFIGKGLKIAAILIIASIAVTVLSDNEKNDTDIEKTTTSDTESNETEERSEEQKETESEEIPTREEERESKEKESKVSEERLNFKDGSYYIGETLNGKPDGIGIYYYAKDGELNGDVYEGNWKDGKRNGEGEYTWASGQHYVGNWKDGKQNGEGEHTWPSGQHYVGNYKDGVRSGYGEMHYANGDVYKGNWEDGKLNGEGEYTWPDGKHYVGNYKDGVRSGYGELYYASGNVYKGNWENDKQNGEGEYTWPNGKHYVGNYKDGVQSGYGEMHYASGDVYKGNWENDKLNGEGEYTWASGQHYVGNWENNRQNGEGEYTWPNGNHYVGNYKDGVRSGYGEMHYANGNVYKGNWENDKRDGQGTLYDANGTVIKSGVWKNDEL